MTLKNLSMVKEGVFIFATCFFLFFVMLGCPHVILVILIIKILINHYKKLHTRQRTIIPRWTDGTWDVLWWPKSNNCHIIWHIRWQHSCLCGAFDLVSNNSVAMKVFPLPLLFSLVCIGFHVEPFVARRKKSPRAAISWRFVSLVVVLLELVR